MQSSSNPEIQEVDISHLRRGDAHPFEPGKVLMSWRRKFNGDREPLWGSKASYEKNRVKSPHSPKWDDTVILRWSPPKIKPIKRKRGKPKDYAHFKNDAEAIYQWFKTKESYCIAKGIYFDLTPTTVPQIPEFCPILGIPLKRNRKFIDDYSPSLDRIIPSRGYTEGNIIWISSRANRIKSNARWEEIRKVADFYEKLCPDMSEVPMPTPDGINAVRNFLPALPKTKRWYPPKKFRLFSKENPRGPSKEQQERRMLMAFTKETKEIDMMERRIALWTENHYRELWNSQNSHQAKTQKAQELFLPAMEKWKATQPPFGRIPLLPREFHEQIGQFCPYLKGLRLDVFCQAIFKLLKFDKCFHKQGERNGCNAYIFYFGIKK